MTGIDRRPDAEAEYRDHLERSRAVWDRWSGWYGASERDFEPIRTAVIDHMDVAPGDHVLDVGCGPGVNFSQLRAAVGEHGRVVAVDFSPEMVRSARERVDANGWENVSVIRADATTADLGGPYDAAVASLALSVLPAVERGVRNVWTSLAPGASLGVVDLRLFQAGPARVVNPFLRWFFRWYANWNPDEDVLDAMATVFDRFELIETYLLGLVYTAKATRIEG